jgi:FK506-binding protein 2
MHKKGFVIICVAIATAALLLQAQPGEPAAPEAALPQQPSVQEAVGEKFLTPGGVTVERTAAPSGARDGDLLWVHYTGRLTDGTVFDSSYERGEPIPLQLGAGRVIAGWEEGLRGTQVGEKRQLTIPSRLAYGEKGSPPKIPPDATLVFDVELMGLQRREPAKE